MQNLNADLSNLYNQCHLILSEYGHIKEYIEYTDNFYIEIMMWTEQPVFKIAIIDSGHRELGSLLYKDFQNPADLIQALKQACEKIAAKNT